MSERREIYAGDWIDGPVTTEHLKGLAWAARRRAEDDGQPYAIDALMFQTHPSRPGAVLVTGVFVPGDVQATADDLKAVYAAIPRMETT